jgi:UDP-N-acetylmuramoyl-tripeptide--D-alanyl-D-alanine ligase
MHLIKELIKKVVTACLTWEAQMVLKKHQPKIVCVTGSVGKTSTKDAIATVLATKYKVRKSEKSYNSGFGVPLTILGLKSGWNNPFAWFSNIVVGFLDVFFLRDYPEWLVLEVGADRPKDIKTIARWLPCDVAVLTSFPDTPVHVEFFRSPEDLWLEDMQMAYHMGASGMTVVNGDDKNIAHFLPNLEMPVTTFGFDKKNDWVASKEVLIYDSASRLSGLEFSFKFGEETYHTGAKGMVGHHQIYVILSALAVGQACGIEMSEGLKVLAHHMGPPGRLRVIEGIKNTIILDDTYNSSPDAVLAGLDTLAKIKTKGRRIAVLGDMLELGEHTIEAHRDIGRVVGTVCDYLIVVGLRSKFTLETAGERGMKNERMIYCDDSLEAGRKLQDILNESDVIFVKGSQSMRMEKVVEEVMAHPEEKEKLLCRQELEWQSR